MRRISGILVLTMIFASCLKEPTLPVEEHLLEDILYEKYIAQAALDRVLPAQKDSLFELYENQILDSYSVSSEDFHETMDLLVKDLDRFKDIHENVWERLKTDAKSEK